MGLHQEVPTAPPGPNCGCPASVLVHTWGLDCLFTPGANLTSLLSTTVFQMNYDSANRRFFPEEAELGASRADSGPGVS